MLCLLSLPHFLKAADETHHPLQQADGYWHSLRSFRKGGRSWCLLWRWNISQIKSCGFGGVRHHPVSFPPRSVGTSQCTVFLPSICENLGLIPSPAKFDRAWEERRDFLCALFVCLLTVLLTVTGGLVRPLRCFDFVTKLTLALLSQSFLSDRVLLLLRKHVMPLIIADSHSRLSVLYYIKCPLWEMLLGSSNSHRPSCPSTPGTFDTWKEFFCGNGLQLSAKPEDF